MSERRIRLFVVDALTAGTVLELGPRAQHYLRSVMRCRTGDAVLVFNGSDGEWRAELVVERRAVVATVAARVRPQLSSPILATAPILAMALVKRPAFELIVEKATELGVRAIQPLVTDCAAVDRLNQERLRAIAMEAAEQSERLTVPAILPPCPLAAWLAARGPTPPLYVALERAEAKPITTVRAAGDLLVGPEGGFSAAERERLRDTPGCVAVSLGANILRAETAAIVGLGALALGLTA